MKKKIIVLILLILAVTAVFLSQNGWCRMQPRSNYDPWQIPACTGTSTNNPHIRYYDSVNTNIDNSSVEMNSAKIINRGENGLNNFRKEKENQGQVDNKL